MTETEFIPCKIYLDSSALIMTSQRVFKMADFTTLYKQKNGEYQLVLRDITQIISEKECFEILNVLKTKNNDFKKKYQTAEEEYQKSVRFEDFYKSFKQGGMPSLTGRPYNQEQINKIIDAIPERKEKNDSYIKYIMMSIS